MWIWVSKEVIDEFVFLWLPPTLGKIACWVHFLWTSMHISYRRSWNGATLLLFTPWHAECGMMTWAWTDGHPQPRLESWSNAGAITIYSQQWVSAIVLQQLRSCSRKTDRLEETPCDLNRSSNPSCCDFKYLPVITSSSDEILPGKRTGEIKKWI